MSRHILYFDGDFLSTCVFDGQILVHQQRFSPTEQGESEWLAYHQNQMEQPVLLLLDCAIEDFYLCTLPHVSGANRKALHQRTERKYFLKSTLVRTQVQGRKLKGRRDDIVLVSGVSGSSSLSRWLVLIEQSKIPLQGIVSLPLLAEQALTDLRIEDESVLLISMQSDNQIRHSFYHQGHLKTSRLSTVSEQLNDTERHEKIAKDIAKTVMFLEGHEHINKRMLNNMQLHFIGHDAAARSLQTQLRVTEPYLPELHYHSVANTPWHSVPYFAALLLNRRSPKNHYADKTQRKEYIKNRASLWLLIAAVAWIVLACVVSLGLWLKRWDYEAQAPQLLRTNQQYNQQYEAQIGELSDLKVDVNDVKSSVELTQKLKQRFALQPQSFLLDLSSVLSNYQNIRVQDIQWDYMDAQLSSLDTNEFMGLDTVVDDETYYNEENKPLGARYRATIITELIDQGDSPKQALDYANQILSALQRDSQFISVTPLKLPFDLNSDSAFSMNSTQQKENTKVLFSFVVEGG